jgi:hypothetical protein
MSVFEKMDSALIARDADAFGALIAEDGVFVRHGTGTEVRKSEVVEMIRRMMASDKMHWEARRCLYENDDIVVMHETNTYPDGSREAVLLVGLLKGVKVTRLETGATPLPG